MSLAEVVSDADETIVDPDNGITTAIAPATGNQTIIHTNNIVLNNFILI